MRGLKLLLISAAIFLVTSCTSIGTDFDLSVADSFIVGETTFEQVVDAIGSSPIGQRTLENGNKRYRWAYAYGDAALQSKAKSLDLEFDSNGVLVQEVQRTEI